MSKSTPGASSNSPQIPEQPVELLEAIYKALNGHKMINQKIRDTDMALPLVDYLTPEGWTTINGGMEENEAIAETVMEAIAPYLKREYSNRQGMLDSWQPIETAPKDGTRILVACLYNTGTRKGEINCVSDAFWSQNQEDEWADIDGIMGQEDVALWTPMPTTPKRNVIEDGVADGKA